MIDFNEIKIKMVECPSCNELTSIGELTNHQCNFCRAFVCEKCFIEEQGYCCNCVCDKERHNPLKHKKPTFQDGCITTINFLMYLLNHTEISALDKMYLNAVISLLQERIKK